MLERLLHADSCFGTLTYSDEHVPEGGSVVPKHGQDWLKRFRKAIEPVKVRYYFVGEYGDITNRPHYHVAIFGYPPCIRGVSKFSERTGSCCVRCDLVRNTWGLGHVSLGSLEVNSAQYIAGYVTKKMTSKGDERLSGRHPEFARMSLRPGIGFGAMDNVAEVLLSLGLEDSLSDVPTALRHGARLLPLGRYLRRRLRRLIGRDEKVSQAAMDELSREMLDLRLAARSSTEHPGQKWHVSERNKGRVAGIRARSLIQKKRGML